MGRRKNRKPFAPVLLTSTPVELLRPHGEPNIPFAGMRVTRLTVGLVS